MSSNSTSPVVVPTDSWINTYGWLVAVIIVLIGSVISNFGLNLQKLALNIVGNKPKQQIWWVSGISCVILGSFADFFALAYGAQSVVAPLGSMTVVSNVFLAPMMQGETVTRQDLIFTGVIICGCVVTVAFASHANADYTINELFAFYTTGKFKLYIFFILSLLAGAVYCINYIERMEKTYGLHHHMYVKYVKFHRFSYAAISGIAGAQSVLFAKLLVSLIKASLNGSENMLADPYSYIVLVSMLASIGLQVYWLNCGLARWDALYNVPVFQSFWISFSEIGGGVVYGEFEEFTFLQGMMFLLGSLITITGVYLLSQRKIESNPDSLSVSSPKFKDLTGLGGFVKLTSSGSQEDFGQKGVEINTHRGSRGSSFSSRFDEDLDGDERYSVKSIVEKRMV